MSDRPAGVDFFARQHSARGTTAKLVALFVLAVLAIVVVINVVVVLAVHTQTTGDLTAAITTATILTLLVIAGGSFAKMASLRSGGSAVARSLGAVPVDPTTSDPQLRRFVNVVEEMSIASGVPMPRLFVLQREDAINAFAAGFTPADAAVTVTQGALQRLNRDELQGVIGHEFSHILNGDMRMNIRLIGLLYGILLLGLIGLRTLQFGGGNRRDNKGGAPILVIALALLVLGFVGQFFAGLIKAAVSRQREWLADASSVQFTRQPSGLVGALKKIAGLPAGSALHDTAGERQVSHMLFGEGRRSLSQLWATHPPLVARIQALEPDFRADDIAQLEQAYRASPPNGLAEDAELGLVSGGPAVASSAAASEPTHITPDHIAARVGTFTPEDLLRGQALSSQLNPQLHRLAGQPATAVALVFALLLNPEPDVRRRQLALVAEHVAPQDAAAAESMYAQIAAVPALLRLPLADLALPALTARPRPELDAVVAALYDLALADQSLSVFEYCLTRLVSSYVRDTVTPARRGRPGHTAVGQVQDAAATLLAVVAQTGNDSVEGAQRAYSAGLAALGVAPRPYQPPSDFAAALDAVWAALDGLDPRHKRPLVTALATAIADDGVLAVAEAELLRTACGLLHCPLPALLA